MQPIPATFFDGQSAQAQPVYDVSYEARIVASKRSAQVSVRVAQNRGELKALYLTIDPERHRDFQGDGDLTVGDRTVEWKPPAGGGRLRYTFLIDQLRDSGRYDARCAAEWALFRGDDRSGDPSSGGHRELQSAVDALLDRGQLEMAAITYLRGRSITDEYVIVDEAQNLELPTLKVILTRMAAGSKVVFCGDLSQVDNPYISPYGGLAALIEKMKGSDLFGHVTMSKGVRSPLAELAATTF